MVEYLDKRPRHQQIAADLRAQIMAGVLSPDEQLPSTQQLVAAYGSANATVQRAVSLLKDEGFLIGKPGKGVYVRDKELWVVDAAAYIAPSPGKYTYDLTSVIEERPPIDVAKALQLDDEGTAVLRRRTLLHEDEPVELSYSYYPSAIASGTALGRRKKIPQGAPKVLEDRGYPQRHFTDRVSTRPPTTEEAQVLRLPEGVPVIRQFRVIYTDEMVPVEVSILIKSGHLYEVRYRQSVS